MDVWTEIQHLQAETRRLLLLLVLPVHLFQFIFGFVGQEAHA